MGWPRWRSVARLAVNIVVLAALAWVIYGQRTALASALDMRLTDFCLIAGFSAAMWAVTSLVFCEMLRALGAPMSLPRMFGLNAATGLLNHVPARLGTLYRARYLKHRSGLSYAYFGSFTIVTFVVIAVASGIVGALAVAIGYGLSGRQEQTLFAGFVILAVASAAPLICAPVLTGNARWRTIWNRMVDGRNRLLAHPRLLVYMFVGNALAFIFSAMCFIGAFNALHVEISFVGCLILGAVGRLALLIGITPGAVGIQEFVVAAAAYLIGIPVATSVVAGAIIRAVLVILYVLIGVPALLALRYRSPRETPASLSSERP